MTGTGPGPTAPFRIRTVGLTACLVEVPTSAQVAPLYRYLTAAHRRGDLPGVVDLVPGARTVLLDGLPAGPGRAALAHLLADRAPEDTTDAAAAADAAETRLVTVPVRYDGPDLAEVARLSGLDVNEVITLHTWAPMTVDFCGFAPGFAYIGGLPEPLRLPRLDTPRTAVPAGSVAIAEGYTGIYPRRSPGGWRILGHTTIELWNTDWPQPALLSPGTRVQLVAIP